jgi:hypothetical protein
VPLAETGLAGVAAWQDSAVRFRSLPSAVARGATRDEPLGTRLLELTTAAEGLRRLIVALSKRMADEQAKEARNKALGGIRPWASSLAVVRTPPPSAGDWC